MNEINEPKKLKYDLDYEGLFILDKLSKWNRIIGILLIVMGVISLLGIFADSSNLGFVIFTIVLSLFMVYLGTRLNAASTNFRHSIATDDSHGLKFGLNNLRQYFMITGISYFVGFIMMLLIMIFGAFFGFSSGELYNY
jgi:hypothetical protein